MSRVVLTWIPDQETPKEAKIGKTTVKCAMVASKSKDVGKSWVLDFSDEAGARKIERGLGAAGIWKTTLNVEWRVVECDGEKTVTIEHK